MVIANMVQELAQELQATEHDVMWLSQYIADHYSHQITDEATAIEAVREGIKAWSQMRTKLSEQAMEAEDRYHQDPEGVAGQKWDRFRWSIYHQVAA